MVLYKRKPVVFVVPPALPDDLDTPVWYIESTKEWFMEYEEYLNRIDYYGRRKFVCEITGNSCLTFFEAHASEIKEIGAVEAHFPEPLKEPVLRYLQFNTISRLDQLVDEVYSKFKNDFYPGELVYIKLHGAKQKGIVREKARFNAISLSNGDVRPAYCQYRVTRVSDALELTANEAHLFRDRTNFTKWYVKTFIKLTVARSSKVGAPWIVKEPFAKKYRIPQEYPPHLVQFKESTPVKKVKVVKSDAKINPQSTAKLSSLKKKAALNNLIDTPSPIDIRPIPSNGLVPIQPAEPQMGQNMGQGYFKVLSATGGSDVSKQATPQPTRKTIVEDLSLALELIKERPKPKKVKKLTEVADALESWTFLNVYRRCLHLDTFTFDDFIYALDWDDQDMKCELLDEIFCAVLSCIIGDDKDDLLVNIPPKKSFLSEDRSVSDNEDEEIDNEDKMEIDDPEELDVPKKAGGLDSGRSGSESSEEKRGSSRSGTEESEEEEDHNAYTVMNYRNSTWQDRLRRRNFRDGNWQCIMIGVLSLVDHVDKFADTIEEIYNILAPIDMPPTPTTVLNQFYKELHIDLRIKALNIICGLLVSGVAIRTHMDDCMEHATKIRRDRLENIRLYKQSMELAASLDKECADMFNALTNGTNDQPKASDLPSDISVSVPVEEEINKKKRPRRLLSVIKTPTPEQLELSKTNAEFGTLMASKTAALLKCDELRLDKKDLERQLNEIDCQRIRLIGRDRLYNRYWWFENNGLPTLNGGMKSEEDEDNEDIDEDDDSEEVLDETYLMGRLWVQGPSIEDREVYLQLADKDLIRWYGEITKEEEETSEFDDIKVKSEPSSTDIKQEKEEEKIVEETKPDVAIDANKENDTTTEMEDEPEPILKKLDFTILPKSFKRISAEVFNIEFDIDTIKYKDTSKLLVDEYGASASVELKPIERKIIEENPDPLISTKDWRFYESSGQIDALIEWLNPWGKRESQLRKELISLKDRISSSIAARRKALWLDKRSDKEIELENILGEIVLSDSEESVGEVQSSDGGDSDSDEKQILRPLPRTRRGAAQSQVEEEMRIKREDRNREKQLKNKASSRISHRETKKRKLKEHQDKKDLVASTTQKINHIKTEREKVRVLEWVNSSAVEKLGHTHYDGSNRKKTAKKNGRR